MLAAPVVLTLGFLESAGLAMSIWWAWVAMDVSGEVRGGTAYAWSGAMLFPAAQPMQPVNLSAARGVSFRVRGAGSFQVALFTQRGGRVPAVLRIESTDAWTTHVLAWSDFGDHDGADVQGIAIMAGPEAGAFDFRLDDVQLTR